MAIGRQKMCTHLKSVNRKIWEDVEKKVELANAENPTPREEEKLQFNDIALSAIDEAIDPKVFEQIKDLESAHEAWKRFEESFEGTQAVKGAKSYILKEKFTSFKMQGESIAEMFYRIQVIMNDLKGLGEEVKDKDFSHKVLRCLPPRFDTLVTILVRGGLDTMTPNQALGDVVTQDTYRVERDGVTQEDEKKKNSVAFKSTTSSKSKGKQKMEEPSDDESSSACDDEDEEMTLFVEDEKKKNSVAFKSTTSSKSKGKQKMEEPSDDESSSACDDEDEEMTLFVCRFGKFMKKCYGARRRKAPSKNKEEPRRCFKCKSKDHPIMDCPYNSDDDEKNDKKDKKKDKKDKKMTFKKKKGHSYCVTWDNDASSSDDDDDDSDDER
ncbi:protein pxr-1-like [Miscanthus floridulus]|uniref:protein pxr-1-like n=1 Tax=Miscanthus floridulus TaxID=154761 RepID=UPI003459C8BD